MALDKKWAEEMCRKGIESSRIGAEKRREEAMKEKSSGLKPIPDEIIQAHLPKPTGESRLTKTDRGLWDVYKKGIFCGTFETKGEAWKVLHED